MKVNKTRWKEQPGRHCETVSRGPLKHWPVSRGSTGLQQMENKIKLKPVKPAKQSLKGISE